MPLPRAADKNDPANRTLAIIAIVGVCVMVPLVIFVQQFLIELHSSRLDQPPEALVRSEVIDDPGLSEFALTAKSRVKAIYYLAKHGEYRQHKVPRDELDDDEKPILSVVERSAISRTDRVRLAVVIGEVHGKFYAKELLDKVAAETEPGSDLGTDIAWLQKLYESGPETLPQEARDSLTQRHGWFGRLAMVYGSPMADPARTALLSGYDKIQGLERAGGLFNCASLLVGIVLLIAAIVQLARGDLAGSFDAPAVGGPVYLETFVIFLTCFMALLFSSIPFRGASTTGAIAGMAIGEALQWALIGAIIWPVLRGVRWHALSVDLGLHVGEGVFKEIGCGVLGFLCDCAIAFVVMLIAQAFSEESVEGDPSGFPMFEAPIVASWVVVWIDAIGAVVWAPVCEELMFRGCLYRFLHAKIRWVGAAAVSALIFGAIHPYDIFGLVSVAASGLVFALLREWRGSLIAPITAHFLWNLHLTANELLLLRALDG